MRWTKDRGIHARVRAGGRMYASGRVTGLPSLFVHAGASACGHAQMEPWVHTWRDVFAMCSPCGHGVLTSGDTLFDLRNTTGNWIFNNVFLATSRICARRTRTALLKPETLIGNLFSGMTHSRLCVWNPALDGRGFHAWGFRARLSETLSRLVPCC